MLPTHNPDGSVPRWYALWRAGKYLVANPDDLDRAKRIYRLWRLPLLKLIFQPGNWEREEPEYQEGER